MGSEMCIRDRLQRVGRKHDPNFRLILTDSRRAPQSGAFLEVLGSYDPKKDNPPILKEDRIKYWLSRGVKTSGTVHNLLVDAKIIQGPKMKVSSTASKKESAEKEEKPEEKSPEKEEEMEGGKEKEKEEKEENKEKKEQAEEVEQEAKQSKEEIKKE